MSWFKNPLRKKKHSAQSVFKATRQNFSLDDFLQSRKLEDKLHSDFTKEVPFPSQKVDERNKYLFNLNGLDILYSKSSDDGTAGSLKDHRFQMIATWDPKLKLRLAHNRGVICTQNDNILILPFFFCIIFYKPLNIFVCATHTDNKGDNVNGIYDLYYFDVKGRYIKKLQGHYAPRPPKLAFLDDDSQKILQIDFPEGYYLSEIIRYDLYILSKDKLLGLTDHTGNILLDCLYEKIIVNASHTYAFLQSNKGLFKLNLKTFDQEPLKFHGITEVKNSFIKVHSEEESTSFTLWYHQ